MIKHIRSLCGPPPLTLPSRRFNGSLRTALRTLGRLLFVAGLLPFTGCTKLPVRKEIDFLVQGGRLEQIATSKGSGNNLIFGGRVIGTKVISIEGDVITEQWHVKQGGREANYIVKLTPVPGGGTHIQVTSP